MAKRAEGAFTDPPDPGRISSVEELVESLRALKTWAGNPSYDVMTDRINQARRAAGRPEAELARRTTVADCFRLGRRRLNTELTLAAVEALSTDQAYVAHWPQMFRVIAGETQAAAQVKVLAELPQDLAEFTGRTAEIDRLRAAVEARRRADGAVIISAIEGTQNSANQKPNNSRPRGQPPRPNSTRRPGPRHPLRRLGLHPLSILQTLTLRRRHLDIQTCVGRLDQVIQLSHPLVRRRPRPGIGIGGSSELSVVESLVTVGVA